MQTKKISNVACQKERATQKTNPNTPEFQTFTKLRVGDVAMDSARCATATGTDAGVALAAVTRRFAEKGAAALEKTVEVGTSR
eukprot:1679311-Amphidinium_carterae.2